MPVPTALFSSVPRTNRGIASDAHDASSRGVIDRGDVIAGSVEERPGQGRLPPPSFLSQAQQDFYQFRALLSARAATPPLPLLTAPRRSHCIQPLSQGSLPPHWSAIPPHLARYQAHHGLRCTGRCPALRQRAREGKAYHKVPAATPSRICTLTSQTALSEIVYNTPRIGSAANPTSKRHLRPQIFAFHPTSNAVGIVTS